MSSQLQLRLPGLASDLEPIFRSAHIQVKPRTPLPEIRVEFFPFAGLNHTARFQGTRLLIRVSDIFEDAPAHVVQSLALILLAKLYRKTVDPAYHHTYREFILRREIQDRARIARNTRGRAQRQFGTQGRHMNLADSFDRLNQEYFAGGLDKPRISWSNRRSRYVLGRYDATHHTIFISRFLDSSDVPDYVVNYVMFHEMLHVKHQSRVQDCRILVHTPEFKSEERTFAQYHNAKLWLKSI